MRRILVIVLVCLAGLGPPHAIRATAPPHASAQMSSTWAAALASPVAQPLRQEAGWSGTITRTVHFNGLSHERVTNKLSRSRPDGSVITDWTSYDQSVEVDGTWTLTLRVDNRVGAATVSGDAGWSDNGSINYQQGDCLGAVLYTDGFRATAAGTGDAQVNVSVSDSGQYSIQFHGPEQVSYHTYYSWQEMGCGRDAALERNDDVTLQPHEWSGVITGCTSHPAVLRGSVSTQPDVVNLNVVNTVQDADPALTAWFFEPKRNVVFDDPLRDNQVGVWVETAWDLTRGDASEADRDNTCRPRFRGEGTIAESHTITTPSGGDHNDSLNGTFTIEFQVVGRPEQTPGWDALSADAQRTARGVLGIGLTVLGSGRGTFTRSVQKRLNRESCSTSDTGTVPLLVLGKLEDGVFRLYIRSDGRATGRYWCYPGTGPIQTEVEFPENNDKPIEIPAEDGARVEFVEFDEPQRSFPDPGGGTRTVGAGRRVWVLRITRVPPSSATGP